MNPFLKSESPSRRKWGIASAAYIKDDTPALYSVVLDAQRWTKWKRSTDPKLMADMERDMRKAQRQVELMNRRREVLKRMRLVWNRARPERWKPKNQRAQPCGGWFRLLSRETLDALRAMEAQKAASERVALDTIMVSFIVEAIVDEAADLALRRAKIAASQAAEHQRRRVEEQQVLMEETIRRRQREELTAKRFAAKLRRQQRAEEYRQSCVRAFEERMVTEQLWSDRLREEMGRRRRNAAELQIGAKQEITWFSPQIQAQFSPHSVPWRAFQPARSVGNNVGTKAKVEAAVMQAFVDASAVRPKTPVQPPPSLHPLNRRAAAVINSCDPFVAASSSMSSPPVVPRPPLSRDGLRPIRSFDQLLPQLSKMRSQSRSSVRTCRSRTSTSSGCGAKQSEGHIQAQSVKGTVPFRAAGVLLPVQRQSPTTLTSASVINEYESESVAHLAITMSGGPSKLLPIVEPNELAVALEVAGVDLGRWSDELLQELCSELASLQAALCSSSTMKDAPRLENTPRGVWTDDDGSGDEDEGGSDYQTPVLCPHLLLKRKVLMVQILSENGRLELMQRFEPVGDSDDHLSSVSASSFGVSFVSCGGSSMNEPNYHRMTARLTDRDWPNRVAVAMVVKDLGVDETRVKELDSKPLELQRGSERCCYPSLRCQATRHIVRLYVEGLQQGGFRIHSGEWAWFPSKEYGRSVPPTPLLHSSQRLIRPASRTALGSPAPRLAALLKRPEPEFVEMMMMPTELA